MAQTTSVFLEFKEDLNIIKGKDKTLSQGLSAVIKVGNEIWVANDESVTIEKLSLISDQAGEAIKYGNHEQFLLSDYISLQQTLPDEKGEMGEVDIEGLDCSDGYLWLIGSHSLKRKKPKKGKPAKEMFEKFEVSKEDNRYLLARIPLIEDGGTFCLMKEYKKPDGTVLNAARLSGMEEKNELIKELENDPLLKLFLKIPGKENGFDIEGLAVAGNGHIYIGLRGPVLRGWAVILELVLETDDKNAALLKLKDLHPENENEPSYRKHFLDLGGLGIRDLCVHGSDLLILAGPTMGLDGPVSIFDWKDGIFAEEENFIECDGEKLKKIKDIPYGQGEDHAEGMTLFAMDKNEISSLLIVYDAASVKAGRSSGISADIFSLRDDEV